MNPWTVQRHLVFWLWLGPEAKLEAIIEAGRVILAKKVTQNQKTHFRPLQRSLPHFLGL